MQWLFSTVPNIFFSLKFNYFSEHHRRSRFWLKWPQPGADTGIYSGECEIMKRENYTKREKRETLFKTISLK